MKLLHAINFRFLLISFGVLLAGGVIFYFILENVLDNQLTEQLQHEKQQLESSLLDGNLISTDVIHPNIFIKHVPALFPEYLTDTLLYNDREAEYEPHRQLCFALQNQFGIYAITISKTLFEKKDLIFTIAWITVLIAIMQLLFLYFAMGYFNKKLFAHFFYTLEEMDKYKPGFTKDIQLHSSDIHEFEMLNQSFYDMHTRLSNEFEALQAFTQNASHELQTPLAVIQSKIEILLQYKNLLPVQFKMLDEMSSSIIKLSKINKQLLLLTKIESNQFLKSEQVNFGKIIQEKISELTDFLPSRNISIHFPVEEACMVFMNVVLASILVNNLLSNAIKYTTPDSVIAIKLSASALEITNPGLIRLEDKRIFDRFYSNSTYEDATGLGLAIVKQICELYSFKLNYAFERNVHKFSIAFL